MPQTFQKSAVLIAGPTASGKSALALRVAQARNGVIINADSMQVYRELRLLTARPTPEEEAAAPHRLYGHVSGMESYSVAQWLAEARREIVSCWDAGQTPVICGGTGLYFKALETGLSELPPIPDPIREKWRNTDIDLYTELSRCDPDGAALLNPADRQRLIRALEVIEGTGQPLRHWQARAKSLSILAEAHVERHFVNLPRAELYARAEQRFDLMMQQGALDEVRLLPALPERSQLARAIGVPELRAHLQGKTTLPQAVTLAKTATRQYIKRQLTWWRGQAGEGWEIGR